MRTHEEQGLLPANVFNKAVITEATLSMTSVYVGTLTTQRSARRGTRAPQNSFFINELVHSSFTSSGIGAVSSSSKLSCSLFVIGSFGFAFLAPAAKESASSYF